MPTLNFFNFYVDGQYTLQILLFSVLYLTNKDYVTKCFNPHSSPCFIAVVYECQSYKTFYTLGQIHKLVLKLDNILRLRHYLVIILGHYTQKYSQINFFHKGTISNLSTLFHTSPRFKFFLGLAPGPSRLINTGQAHLTI